MFCIFFFFLNRDHMQWSKEEEDAARKKVEENSATRVAPEEQGKAGILSQHLEVLSCHPSQSTHLLPLVGFPVLPL
jgi:hypothetical protein